MEYRNNTVVIKMSNDKIPVFKEVKYRSARIPYIKYGENNDYPNFLLTLFNRSAKHSAILTSKQTYIKGQGWVFEQKDLSPEDGIALQAYIDNPNPYESLNDLLGKTALDEEIFGGFALRGISNKGGGISQIYHQDISELRSNADNSVFYVSEKWLNEDGSENTNIKATDVKEYPLYDPNVKQTEWIFYYKTYRPGVKYYTLPEYVGAIPYIITDAEIGNFHRAEIQNSFKGSKMIVYKDGLPSEEEMASVERKLKKKFTPTDNAGYMVIDFVDDPARTPEVIDLSGGDFDKKYEALNKTVQEEILFGHKITSPMLFGIRTEGQLGGRNELVDAFNLFQNIYVAPKQEIQRMVYDYLSPIKGFLNINPLNPIMPSFSESTLLAILSVDEMRAIIGMKPKEIVITPQQDKKKSSNKDEELSFINDEELNLEVFMKYGEEMDKFEILKHNFASSNVTRIEQGILDLVKKTPDISNSAIAKVMDLTISDLKTALSNLENLGLVKVGSGNNNIVTITTKGSNITLPSFEDLFIRYSYELRPDAPALVSGGKSRPFCAGMMTANRLYSKADIDAIGLELGSIYGINNYDAFTMAGGWYHDPVSDTNFPHCRHYWNSKLVKRKA